MSEAESHFFLQSTPEDKGERIDKALSRLLPRYSRSAIQRWIRQGHILIDNIPVSQKFRLSGGETVEINIPPAAALENRPEPMAVDIIHEDEQIIVLNKPANLVVHPGAGNPDATLMNGLLYHHNDLARLPRAGIIHRLDKDTTGLMVVAKTEQARQHLIAQLGGRKMSRQYLAVVNGIMISGETIDQPIGRHHRDRLRMAVTSRGKPAITHIRVAQKFRRHCLVRASLESGRTHQIRVHLSFRGYPVVGDKLYGQGVHFPPSASELLKRCLQSFRRQALHAEKIALTHPKTNKKCCWELPPPDDLQQLISLLRDDMNCG